MVAFDLAYLIKYYTKKYTFSERLKNKFLKSTTNLAVLIYVLEIRFEMF